MLDLEYGEVKFFDRRDGKRYGFLFVLNQNGEKTGEEIFFHGNDGEWVEIVEDKETVDIQFIGRNFGDEGPRIHDPREGDRIAFRRTPGNNGRDKAAPWTYTDAYTHRVRKLTEPYYRVIQVTWYKPGFDQDNEKIIWEGQGNSELSRLFPLLVIEGRLHDPLATSVTWKGGKKTRYRFEKWVPEAPREDIGDDDTSMMGHWRRCDDPRYRSAEVRGFEQQLAAAS